MNVMINDISTDLNTTVQGVQIAITLFLLVMAALMIPGSKLSDRWGRKRCSVVGLAVYGIGALLSTLSPGLGILIIGNSIFECVGSALLIPRSTSSPRCSSPTCGPGAGPSAGSATWEASAPRPIR